MLAACRRRYAASVVNAANEATMDAPRISHYITDLGDNALTDHAAHPAFPRYGVWEKGGHHRHAAIIATGDDLCELCKFYGLDPKRALVAA